MRGGEGTELVQPGPGQRNESKEEMNQRGKTIQERRWGTCEKGGLKSRGGSDGKEYQKERGSWRGAREKRGMFADSSPGCEKKKEESRQDSGKEEPAQNEGGQMSRGGGNDYFRSRKKIYPTKRSKI